MRQAARAAVGEKRLAALEAWARAAAALRSGPEAGLALARALPDLEETDRSLRTRPLLRLLVPQVRLLTQLQELETSIRTKKQKQNETHPTS